MRQILVVIATAVVVGSSVLASAQGPQTVGRYQLVGEQQGTMFLVDTATGRVWRYTLLTEQVTSVAERERITIRNLYGRETYSEDPAQKAVEQRVVQQFLKEKVTRDVGERYCRGMTSCFYEVDRLRLTPGGDWTSELFGPKP
jgi:hypothetical protein